MRRTLTRLVALGAALGFAASAYIPAARAANTNASPVTVTVWTAYNKSLAATFNTLISRFEQVYPYITVQQVSSPNYTALLQKEQSAVFAGNTPTIGQSYEEWTAQFAKSNAVQDLTPYINGKHGLSKASIKDFYSKVWADGLLGKKRYMMPFSKSDIVLYFDGPMLRRSGIKSPPKTWDEFAADCKKLTKGGSHPSQWCMTYQLDESDFYAWEYEWGNHVLNSKDKAAFGTKQGSAPLAFFRNIVNKHEIVVSATANYQDQTDFDNGKTAFDVGSIAGLPYFKSGAIPGVATGVAQFPAGPMHRATELYGAPFVMFSKASSAEKDAGWLFLKWLTESRQSEYWSENTGYLPIRKSEFKAMASFYRKNPQLLAATTDLKYALNEPALVGWAKARDDIGTDVQAALTGSKSPLAAVKDAANQVDSDLSQGS